MRAGRLAAALARFKRSRVAEFAVDQGTLATEGRKHFSVTERGRILLVPVDEVRYLKAEMKYVTATTERDYVLDESLATRRRVWRAFPANPPQLPGCSPIVGVEREGDGLMASLAGPCCCRSRTPADQPSAVAVRESDALYRRIYRLVAKSGRLPEPLFLEPGGDAVDRRMPPDAGVLAAPRGGGAAARPGRG